jgi:hypothetical protein
MSRGSAEWHRSLPCSNGCWGSYDTSLPAVLPFLHCMPAGSICEVPHRPATIMSAIWNGCASLASRDAMTTASQCYQVPSIRFDRTGCMDLIALRLLGYCCLEGAVKISTVDGPGDLWLQNFNGLLSSVPSCTESTAESNSVQLP